MKKVRQEVTKQEAVEYLAAMIEEMRKMAVAVGAHTLAHILAQAAEEARQLIGR